MDRKPLLTTIDVEEWWSVQSFHNYFKFVTNFPDDRPLEGLSDLLQLLKKYNGEATFFILGRFAEKHPDIIEFIVSNGHHIGTHGYSHELVYNQSQLSFARDLKQSIKILEKIIQNPVTCYRAPSYSITKKSLWALPILADNGILIDSSIFPTKNSRFGIASAPNQPYRLILSKNSEILEIPPNVFRIAGLGFPITSGIFFRLFPISILKYFLRKNTVERRNMLIWHNWEFDTKQPILKAGLKAQFIHYMGISKMIAKSDLIFQEHIPISLKSACQPALKIALEKL